MKELANKNTYGLNQLESGMKHLLAYKYFLKYSLENTNKNI